MTKNKEKSCMVERWNRTMKEIMFKYFTANSINRYINVLDQMVDLYNNREHSSIKMTPVEASFKENKRKVWNYLYGSRPAVEIKPKFNVRDRVRISKFKRQFEKGYTMRW